MILFCHCRPPHILTAHNVGERDCYEKSVRWLALTGIITSQMVHHGRCANTELFNHKNSFPLRDSIHLGNKG